MYGDSSILQRTKEHCLLGIKGTLKRSEDTHFIHANCDTDLIMQDWLAQSKIETEVIDCRALNEIDDKGSSLPSRDHLCC